MSEVENVAAAESPNLKSKLNEKLIEHAEPTEESYKTTATARPSLHELATRDFYKNEHWFDVMCEILFKIKTRNTTIKAEIYYGFIHFVSCLYCLAVIPQQLNSAGYGSRSTVVSVAACSGVGSIFCGLFANLPFVLAPPTVVSIFLSVYLQQHDNGPNEGNIAVIFSGFILILFGWKPLFQCVAQLIPISIQVGTAVGIGLMTALAGSTEINLVVKGKYTILDIGNITVEVVISMLGVLLICVTMVYHIKGSFCLAVVVCSLIWWIYDDSFPTSVFAAPHSDPAALNHVDYANVPLLTVDLVFLYILYLNGLVTSLSNLAVLTRKDGSAPRGRWIFIMSGVFTILGGLLSAPPILISPESSASIKAGAKTGLSTVICGVLFCLSLFLSPIFEMVPPAGTSPILIMIGVILFQNVARIDWRNVSEAAPAFVVLFYIPFTYSVIQGVILGYIVYIVIAFSSGDLRDNSFALAVKYFPSWEPFFLRAKAACTFQASDGQRHKDSVSSHRSVNASFDLAEGHRSSYLNDMRSSVDGRGDSGINMTLSMGSDVEQHPSQHSQHSHHDSQYSQHHSTASNPLNNAGSQYADFGTGFRTNTLQNDEEGQAAAHHSGRSRNERRGSNANKPAEVTSANFAV